MQENLTDARGGKDVMAKEKPKTYKQRNQQLITDTYKATTKGEQGAVIKSALQIADERVLLKQEYDYFVAQFRAMLKLRSSLDNFTAIRDIANKLKKPDYNPDYDFGLIDIICDAIQKDRFSEAQKIVRSYVPPQKVERKSTIINRAMAAINAIKLAETKDDQNRAIHKLRMFSGDFYKDQPNDNN